MHNSVQTNKVALQQDMFEVARLARTVHWLKPRSTRLNVQWTSSSCSVMGLLTPHSWVWCRHQTG